MNATTRPSVLTIFVAGVDNQEEAEASQGKEKCAYGIFYDSTRYSAWNGSAEVIALDKEPVWRALAVERGIMYTLLRAPRYHSLIIETDDVFAVCAINDRIMSRDKDRAATLEVEQRLKDPAKLDCVGRIVDLIELRTKRGECFVDVVDSSQDPTAKDGLQRARNLALEALNKTDSSA